HEQREVVDLLGADGDPHRDAGAVLAEALRLAGHLDLAARIEQDPGIVVAGERLRPGLVLVVDRLGVLLRDVDDRRVVSGASATTAPAAGRGFAGSPART